MSDVAEIQDEFQDVPAEVNELRWASLRRRRGLFVVTEQALVECCNDVFGIMGECIVTRCDHNFSSQTFEFSALSWQFREAREGEMAPKYVWKKGTVIAGESDIWIAREIEVKS